ncbi:MAG TPA: CHASE3 domain-containing protein [Pirellulales bacterium]|jgi:PAS domain S-box-containing protein
MKQLPSVLIVAIAVIVVVMAANRWFAHRNITHLNDAVTEVAHTHHVLDLTSEVLNVAVDAETGQRGFVLTGDEIFLQPYDAAVKRLNERLAQLADETRDDPLERERVVKLSALVSARLERLAQAIVMYRERTGGNEFAALSKAGKQQMDAIRGLVGEIKADERRMLVERTDRARATYRIAVGANIVTGALALAVLAAFVVLASRSMAAGRRQAEAIQFAHHKLQQEMQERNRVELALRESERIYRAIGESIDYGVWLCDADGKNTYASPAFLNLVGMTQEECSEFGWGKALHADDVEDTIAAWQEFVRTGETWDREHRFRGRDGQWHPILARGVPVRDEQGALLCWAGINLDISRMKHTEEELHEAHNELEQRIKERTNQLMHVNEQLQHEVLEHSIAEASLRERAEEIEALMDILPTPVWIAHDAQCHRITGNRAAYNLVQLPAGTNLSLSVPIGKKPADFSAFGQGRELAASELPLQRATASSAPVPDHEIDLRRADGVVRRISAAAVPLFDHAGNVRGAIASTIDITERRALENNLRASLDEKEVLLKEVHHRVKNNLQVISSLLYLQSQQTHDELSIEMFSESQQRVRSMALVHERLYRSPDLAQVDFAEYITCLGESLLGSDRASDRIRLLIDVHDVKLSIDNAVPCGLLVNELLSNCLKHAFADRDHGCIEVELHSADEREILLSVRDDGVGLPEHVHPETSPTFGMQVIMALVDQLHGSLHVERALGTEFQIRFPPAPLARYS